jgi:hypothetical protein
MPVFLAHAFRVSPSFAFRKKTASFALKKEGKK